MKVTELWRYPVKSLQGERCDRVRVDADGLFGDRRFALFDRETGFGLTSRRVPELLYASARWHDDGSVDITLPDGTVARDDDALSAWLGRNVELRTADFDATRSYEVPLDIETESEDSWVTFNGARGPFHDSRRTRVSLVSTGSVGDWDARRFRANVVLDGDGEDALTGRRVQIGDAVLDVTKQIDRCVMVNRPQPGGIQSDVSVLRTIMRTRGGRLAIGALVLTAGTISVGDDLVVASTA